MIKPIVTDRKLLSKVCTPVSDVIDKNLVDDLLDTAAATTVGCLGLAAPQIGYNQRAILILLAKGFTIMFNPEYMYKKGKLINGKEACFSRPSTIKNPVFVRRYYKIRIKYTDISGNTVEANFKSFQARVVQHEIDHLDGILI